MVIHQIPSFNPNPSLKAALHFLREIGFQNYALIGRVATWVFLPTDLQQFTKDFAIFYLCMKWMIYIVNMNIQMN